MKDFAVLQNDIFKYLCSVLQKYGGCVHLCTRIECDTSRAPPITEQIAAGNQWAAEHGHRVVIVHRDNGYSGGDWKRPDWNQSINDAKRHLWTVQWVWNQDRLARDTEQFLGYYRQLDNAKVKIFEHSANDFIDMSSLGGRVKHTQLAAAAEIFRMVTSEKVKKAYERNKKLGKPWGRKKTVWDVAKAQELRAAGKGWREIAKQVGVSYQTVRRELCANQ